jgi:hypothetical protein
MGCCVSSAKSSASQKHHYSSVGTHPVGSANANENRASHSLAEEETVKEVPNEFIQKNMEDPNEKPPIYCIN